MSLSDGYIVAHKERIDHVIAMAQSYSDNPEAMAHWSRYVCVLAAGFLEVSVQRVLIAYATKQASPEVSRFVGEQLKHFQNANMEKILQAVGCFDVAKRQSLEAFVEGELKDAVNSIVGNRHQIVHGQNMGISMVIIRGYFQRAVKVIEEVERLFA